MTMNRILATVSAIALTTAAGVSGANAYTALFDLTPPVGLTGLTVSASVLANEQSNTGSIISALNSAAIIAIPVLPGAQDVDGGTIAGVVATNTIYAIGIGNLAADGYPGLSTEVKFGKSDPGNLVDLFTADGKAGKAAATAASLQANVGGSIDVDNEDAIIAATFIDLGVGSTITLDQNEIYAEAAGNMAVTSVSGDINPGLVGGELGNSTVTNPAADELQTGATVLAASAQENIDLADLTADVSDARIGSLATVNLAPDPTLTTLEGSQLDVTDNLIRAQVTGNDAGTTVVIDNDKSLTLNGSAGVSNLQVAVSGISAYEATVSGSVIEFGDSAGGKAVVDLEGSALNFTGNDILAAAAANQAASGVLLDKGVTITGPTPGASQANTFVVGAPDVANVAADLFVQSVQYSDVTSLAESFADLNVLVEDLVSSSSVDATGNSIGAEASGNEAASIIQVLGAQTLDTLVALQSVQYNEEAQLALLGDAANGSNLLVSVATLNSAGIISDSAVTTEDNRLYTQVVGNDSNSAISLNGGTIDGKDGTPTLRVNRPAASGANPADISLVNAQVSDGAAMGALTLSNIRVNLALNGGVASAIKDSAISTSENEISALTIGNRSTESSIDITATTLNATAGVINSQTVEDDSRLIARTDSAAPFTGQLQVWAFPNQISNSQILTDGNVFSAVVIANQADASTNALTVDAQTIDNNAEFPYVRVDRGATTSDLKVSSGLAVVNDQSVEDLETLPVTAASGEVVDPAGQGDLILVRVGLNNQFPLTDSTFSVDDNQGTVAATLNEATSKLTVKAGTLDSPTALVNVQSVADDDNDGKSAAMIADQFDADITLSVGNAGDGAPASIGNTAFSIDSNDLLASATVNTALNMASITAGTQALTTTRASAYAVLFDQNVDWVNVNAENMLVNDQVFTNLYDSGNGQSLQVVNDNSDLDLIIGTTGAFDNNEVSIDANTMTVEAFGNEAVNSLALDVGNFDLSKASASAGPANGPIAILASNQVGEVVGQGSNKGISARGLTLRGIIDLNNVTGAIDSSAITIDGNEFQVHAEANNVVNTLSAKGTKLPDVQGTTAPTADVGDTSLSFPIGFSPSTTFGVASRQVNGLNVTAQLAGNGLGTPAGLRIEADNTPSIDATALSIDDNVFSAEARGSDSINALSLDYNTNNAQAFLANAQSVGATDPTISAVTFDIEIQIDLDDTPATPPTLTDTSISLSDNTIAALASSNRTANLVQIEGTNVYSGSDAAPGVTVQNTQNAPVPGPENPLIRVTGDLGLVNLQGSAGNLNAIPNGETVTSSLRNVRIMANIDEFDSGSLRVDNNLLLSQAVVHSAGDANLTGDPGTAGNIMLIKADAAIGDVGNSLGASVVSVQTLALDTDVGATVANFAVGSVNSLFGTLGGVDDLSDAESVSVSASNNVVASLATGATAFNGLGVTAGSSITGGSVAPAPAIGFPGANDTTLNADYNLLNVQTGFSDGGTIVASTGSGVIGYQLAPGLSGDSLKVVENLILAQARGFSARNVVSLSAEASSDATAQAGNVQAIDDIDIGATVAVIGIGGDILGGALNSSVEVSGNATNASASGNVALNALSTQAGASLQESSGAGVTVDPAAVSQIAVTGADYAVLNRQSLSDSSVTGTITTASILVDDMGPAGFNTTSVSVEDNVISSSATGNDAANSLVLNTGTFQHPSATIASLQTTSGATVSASTTDVRIGIGWSSTIAGASNGSSFSVRGNSIGSVAIGNSAVNSITGD